MDKKDRIKVYWQAHQSTSHICPENTMAAFKYAWDLGGIPEADIRTTGDGVIICFHDETGERTTDAPDEEKNIPISLLTMDIIGRWDGGIKTGEKYKNERVPALKEVFDAMVEDKSRLLYLDLKAVDLGELARLINEYGVAERIIFSHNNEENLRTMGKMVKGLRTMLWVGGRPETIKNKFEKILKEGFYGLDQLQVHLYTGDFKKTWPYEIDREFVSYAFDKTSRAGVDFEVLIYEFNDKSLHLLLNMGIRWFATDHPEKFLQSVKRYTPD